MSKLLSENWLSLFVVVVVVGFLLGELYHGFVDTDLPRGQGNPWPNLLGYTAHWEALPVDYPRPFYTSPEDRKRIGKVGLWDE